ncbi:hypothetical protein [Pseudomonas sp. LD120]|uniref:hypothetical protein n=1 Tax=Pseudomonas sp. LD120 TaxID=485751 RepID=UPI002115C22F|nr:hypothetical protein [Pseudomonas sp. LD120]
MKRFLMAIGGLALGLFVLGLTLLDFSKAPAHVLAEHPNAQWQGGPDGGHYLEITRSEPPYYFVQIRYESGDLWEEGWLKYGHGGGETLTANNVIAFDGDGVIYLQQRKLLARDKAGAR